MLRRQISFVSTGQDGIAVVGYVFDDLTNAIVEVWTKYDGPNPPRVFFHKEDTRDRAETTALDKEERHEDVTLKLYVMRAEKNEDGDSLVFPLTVQVINRGHSIR